MKPTTTELIQQYYNYFNKLDITSFLGMLDNNVIHDINQGDREIGIDAFAKFMDRMDSSYTENIKDLVIMTNQDGSRAAAEFIVEGTYKATDKGLPIAQNQHYKLPCGAFFEIKNGNTTRVTDYYNLKSWLKQVGE